MKGYTFCTFGLARCTGRAGVRCPGCGLGMCEPCYSQHKCDHSLSPDTGRRGVILGCGQR